MSIWSSYEGVGWDDWDDDPPVGGDVRSYSAGWSNHYPTTDVEQPATVGLAGIPAWCVPGHRDIVLSDERRFVSVGPWLRLDLDSPRALTWWKKDDDGNPTPAPEHASVVMDEAAVRSLRDQLTDWLDRPKIHPHTKD